MIRGQRVSNSVCGRFASTRGISSEVKAYNLQHENDSDLSSCSPVKEDVELERVTLIQRKMERRTVKVMDVSDNAKLK